MNIRAFWRKLIYSIAILAILLPLYLLGQPAVNRDNNFSSAGGILSQIREQYSLGQGDLGKLDPASEAARLATLGMRGVAAAVLWNRANTYKNTGNWDRFHATVNQIVLLQPHFIKVWDFQAHNISYNSSTEFDDYRFRYAWVKKGMEFLGRGIDFNRRDANLPYFQGMMFAQKLGKADEHVQFRKLYSADKDFHDELEASGFNVRLDEGLGADRLPDNWLSGRLWYKRAEGVLESGKILDNFRKSPLHFYSSAPLTLMNYSEAIEKEGILDDRAKFAWQRSELSWSNFGDREIPTTWGHNIKLRGLSESVKRLEELRKQFSAFTGDLYRQAYDERFQKLTPEERISLETPDDKKSERQFMVALTARQKVEPNPTDVAKLLPPETRVQGLELALRIEQETAYREHVDNYRNQVNYNYWETRALAEQSDIAIAARQSLFDAEKLLSDAELDEALKKYDDSWVQWKKLFDTYPILMVDESGDEVLDAIRRYQRALDRELSDDFILKEFIDLRRQYDETGGDIQTLLEISRAAAKKAQAEEAAEEKSANEPTPPTTTDSKPAEAAPVAESPESGEPPAPTAGDGN